MCQPDILVSDCLSTNIYCIYTRVYIHITAQKIEQPYRRIGVRFVSTFDDSNVVFSLPSITLPRAPIFLGFSWSFHSITDRMFCVYRLNRRFLLLQKISALKIYGKLSGVSQSRRYIVIGTNVPTWEKAHLSSSEDTFRSSIYLNYLCNIERWPFYARYLYTDYSVSTLIFLNSHEGRISRLDMVLRCWGFFFAAPITPVRRRREVYLRRITFRS